MKLYSYFRSSASFRVRIALALKGLSYDYVAVHLAKSEQLQPAFDAITPQRLVPVLEDDGRVLTQSLSMRSKSGAIRVIEGRHHPQRSNLIRAGG